MPSAAKLLVGLLTSSEAAHGLAWENCWRMLGRSVWCSRTLRLLWSSPPPGKGGIPTVRVIASSLRKGNIVEFDGKLYVVLSAESFHPGKGTPTTQVDMRRLSDGVKGTDRFKTTEQGERGFVEENVFDFL